MMKKLLSVFAAAISLVLLTGCSGNAIKHFDWEKNVGAHTMPKSDSVYYVNDFGAVGDAVVMNTAFIQKAIDECAAKGGGVVKFTPGIYLTGAVYVKSGVNLEITKGAMIRSSQSIDDFPVIETRVAGIETTWPSAVINIIDQENAAITGDGVIDGRGRVFWEKYWAMRKDYDSRGLRWIVDYDCQRVRGILIQNCKNITLKDFTLFQPGFWAVHILYSQFVTADGLIISNNIEGRGPSTDGIDIDSSCDILVQNCDINCNDDNFCLKAGRDADGLRVNRPTERVVIRNCIARYGDGLFTCGSETSGSIRNIVAYNIKGIGTKSGLRFKSAYNRGGVVEDIYLYNVEMVNVRDPFIVTLNWNPSYSYSELPPQYNYDSIPKLWKVMLERVDPEKGMPRFRNIHFENVKATGSNVCISVTGTETSMVENFTLKNVSIQAEKPGAIRFAKDWTFENVTFTANNGEKVVIENSVNVNLY